MKYLLSVFSLLLLPQVAAAATLVDYVNEAVSFINSVLIPFLFAVAVLFFLVNATRYFVINSANEEGRKQARDLATYGILAFVFLVSLWGIIYVVSNSLGLRGAGAPTSICPDFLGSYCTSNSNFTTNTSPSGSTGRAGSLTSPTSTAGSFSGTQRSQALIQDGAVCYEALLQPVISNPTSINPAGNSVTFTGHPNQGVSVLGGGTVDGTLVRDDGTATVIVRDDESGIRIQYTFSHSGDPADLPVRSGDTIGQFDRIGTLSNISNPSANVSVLDDAPVSNCDFDSLRGVTIDTPLGGSSGSTAGGRTVDTRGTLSPTFLSMVTADVDTEQRACFNATSEAISCSSGFVRSVRLYFEPGDPKLYERYEDIRTMGDIRYNCYNQQNGRVACGGESAASIEVISDRPR